jgi:hypothetical protein
MPGLRLDRFQRHARLSQPIQTGMPQFVTGRVIKSGRAASGREDLV